MSKAKITINTIDDSYFGNNAVELSLSTVKENKYQAVIKIGEDNEYKIAISELCNAAKALMILNEIEED